MSLNAISVSMDQNWMVCGTEEGASVWDAEIRKKSCRGGGWRACVFSRRYARPHQVCHRDLEGESEYLEHPDRGSDWLAYSNLAEL